jgi:hypothetical protein
MIAVVDRLQERNQVLPGPRLPSGRDQDKRQARALESSADCPAQVAIDRGDVTLHTATEFLNEVDERRGRGRVTFLAWIGKLNDPDPGTRESIALEMALKRIVAGLARGHSVPRRCRGSGVIQDGRGMPASHRSSSA